MSESHIFDGQFQSDKYPWCKPGFVPLKLTDPMARTALLIYAELRRDTDRQFSEDIITCIFAEDDND